VTFLSASVDPVTAVSYAPVSVAIFVASGAPSSIS